MNSIPSGSRSFQRSSKRHSGDASPVNFRKGSPKSEVSARKLAAGLWQLRFMEVSGDAAFPFSNPMLESSAACLKCSKEEVAVTKLGPALSEASNVLAKILSRETLGERKLMGDSLVSALLAELLRAQRCINKLKAEQKSSKKKVEQFILKLQDEMVLWKRRESHKIQAMLDDLKDKLDRERRSRERMELLNTKLVHELGRANLSAKQFMASYEEEKKERKLIEEVCNELAMQIGEDKAKLEGLQRDSMKIREEVEEERKMLQMAELWREERIQMKLLDAKVALEDKYNQMIQLIAYLQTFLRSRGDKLDTMDLRDAHLIKHAAESVNIQRIAEPSYDFSKSDDIFSIYEELRKDIVNERMIKTESPPYLTGPSSTIHIVNLDEDGLSNNSALHQSSTSSDYIRHVEDQNFRSPPQKRDTAHDNINHEKNTLESEAECSDSSDLEVCSASELLRSDEGGFRHLELLGQRNSTDTMNPHITRGMKGSIEWPRGIPKTNSKAIPLEERVRTQKSQLQHILKPKA